MSIKVSELTNNELDEWVAKASNQFFDLEGFTPGIYEGKFYGHVEEGTDIHDFPYSPSTDDAQAMALVVEFLLSVGATVYSNPTMLWEAFQLTTPASMVQRGNTPHIAICRAVVASVYGEEVG